MYMLHFVPWTLFALTLHNSCEATGSDMAPSAALLFSASIELIAVDGC